MTRLVCIGDIHFGVRGNNEDRYRALDAILDYGCGLDDLGAWLFAGDLNDAKMTIGDRNQIAPRLQRAASQAPVLIVRGNHDQDGDLAIWERLESTYPIVVAEQPGIVPLRLASGGTASVFCQPYIFRSGLVSLGVQHQQIGADVRTLLDPIYLVAAADLKAATDRGECALMLGHVNVTGAVVSSGQPVVGAEIALDPALLARLGDVPKILGHIHKPQTIHGATYLGSVTRNDFGEREEKAFGVLAFDTPYAWTLTTVPLTTPPQMHIEGRLSREGFVVTAVNGQDATEPPDVAGADVRVRYAFIKAEVGAIDVAHIHALVAGCRSLKLDPLAILEQTVRAPEIAAAETLEDKVAAFAARAGLTVTPGLLAKVTALQTLDGATVLQQVAQAIESDAAAPVAEEVAS